MEIINSDFKKGTVKIRITDTEDLWYLSHLIDPGDFVKGKTTRKVKIGDGDNARVAKKVYNLKIEAETIDYDSVNSSLRVNGKIKEGPEDLPRDNYQAIPLEIKSEFALQKPNWLQYQKQKLKEAAEKKYNYLICILDREEAIFALTKSFGYEVILTLKGNVPKKTKMANAVEAKGNFNQEVIKALEVYGGRYNPEAIILASPAFYKDELNRKIANPEIKNKLVLASCSDVSETSLFEILKKPELEKTLHSSRTRRENVLVDELLSAINKQGAAAYGLKEVKDAIDAGAVSKLLISDNFINKSREEGKYEELDALMKNVDVLNGVISIISSENSSGKKLDGIGGIAAILRYKLNH